MNQSNITVEFHIGNGKLLGFDSDIHTFINAQYDLAGNFLTIHTKRSRKHEVLALVNIKRFCITNQHELRPETNYDFPDNNNFIPSP